MIKKSTDYALVVNRKIVKKGSKKLMVRDAKLLSKEVKQYIIDYQIEVYNTPTKNVGDYVT